MVNPHLRLLNLSGSPGLVSISLIQGLATISRHTLHTLLLGSLPERDAQSPWLEQYRGAGLLGESYSRGHGRGHGRDTTGSSWCNDLAPRLPSLHDDVIGTLVRGCTALRHLSLVGHHRITDTALRQLQRLKRLCVVRALLLLSLLA